jgi:uncharacterized membrane protein
MAFVKSTALVTASAVTVPGLSGGTNGKIVRVTTSNTVVDASYNDSVAQLSSVLLKQNNTYYAYGVVDGFTGLVASSAYFLAANGTLTSSAPTPSSTIRALCVGFALNSTTLLFRPGLVISGQ